MSAVTGWTSQFKARDPASLTAAYSGQAAAACGGIIASVWPVSFCRAFAQQADLWGRNNLQEEPRSIQKGERHHNNINRCRPQSCELRDKGAGGDVRFYCFDQFGYLPLLPAQAGTHRLWWQRLKIGFPRSRDAEPGASKNSPQGHVAWRCSRRRFSRGASTPCTESPPSRSAHHEDVVLDKFRDLQARNFAHRSPISISLCCWSHLRPPARVPLLDLARSAIGPSASALLAGRSTS